MLQALPLLLAAALAPARAAALAFGGGAGLVPLDLRPALLRETLELTPVEGGACWELSAGSAAASGLLLAGPAALCSDPQKTVLRPQWKAVDTYRLGASETALRASFALPLRARKDVRSGLSAAGERDMRAWLDGAELTGAPARVRGPAAEIAAGADSGPAWVFEAELSSGAEHTLRVSYEFDIEYLDAEAEGRTYPKGAAPWITRQGAFSSGAAHPVDSVSALRRVPFALTSSYWDAAPKARVAVRVVLPKSVPETLVAAASHPASCLGRRELAFDLDAKDPGHELAFTFPQPWGGPTRLETAADWSAWKRSVGESAALTCDLSRRLLLDSGAGAQGPLRALPCLLSCDQAQARR